MKYNITQYDKDLLTQESVDYKYRLFIVGKNKNILDELYGIKSIGTYTIDSESDIRRTASLIMYLDDCYRSDSIENKLADWIGCDFELQIGIYSIKDNDYIWYKCGYYLITEANTAYNAADNSITLALSDWYSKLNGTRNGQLGGAPIISIPNEDENGNPVTIKQVTETLLKSETYLQDSIIDDIGQFYGMPQNNPDYEQYRAANPLWNQLPYDLEYEAGCTVGDIFSEINNLYPNCQMYFDIYGNFCFNQIPSCEYDPVFLNDDFLQQIIVAENSENVSYDVTGIKNVTEVFGADYNIDRYSSSCSTANNVYLLTLDDYTDYSSGNMIAFIPDSANISDMKIRINSLASIPLYYEYSVTSIEEDLLEPGKTYVLQIKKVNGNYVAFYMGQYQPHALCVLTGDGNDKQYTKSYFSRKYNCDERNIILRVEPDSPFTVQKLGEILDVKSGGEFENILSDSAAKENALYYNRNASSVNDTVTITTKMVPFLDTNIKTEYKKQQEEEPHCYIITSISNNTESLVSQITMCRFYPLYYI